MYIYIYIMRGPLKANFEAVQHTQAGMHFRFLNFRHQNKFAQWNPDSSAVETQIPETLLGSRLQSY